MTGTARTLLSSLIDYAGLFPPAKLDMGPAVEAYAHARAGEHEWMLGRFVCPCSRLREMSGAAAPLLPGTFARSGYREQSTQGERWRITALIDGDLEECLDTIDRFNEHHSHEENGRAMVDMMEMKATDASEIDAALDVIPEGLFPFFEFPVTTDCRGFIAALAGNSSGAKIRTGGVVGGAFPTVDEVGAFLLACDAADVPFKATAGLHHPCRGNYRLTYEKDSASCTMHGFLNLFLAAAILKSKHCGPDTVREILSIEDPSGFKFSEDVVCCGRHMIEVTDLALVRESFALSFGSCSFDEPVADLRRIGAL
ncbi:MAG: hypothetical protein ACOYN0_08985 [Phycisphaerales bacterium]